MANWELVWKTYDMFGIEYTGHRDLRRILCLMIGKDGH